MNHEPIFIAGPDRSGTTLMFALLASHSRISMVRRTNMWRYFHGQYGDLSQEENFERCLSDMARYNRMRHLQPDPQRIRTEFWQGEPSYARLFALFHEHHAERQGKVRWGDKSLHTEHFAHQLFAEFPLAKVLHMARDPRDRYASVRRRYGRDTRRLGAATGRWLNSMKAGERNQAHYPGSYRIIRYEDLASRPEETLREICDFIHEEYEPGMLAMQGSADYRRDGGNSSFEAIQPGVISTSPIGRFRQVLTPREVAFIERFAGREMQQLGYRPEQMQLTPGDRFRYYGWDIPISLLRMIGWLGLHKMRFERGVRVPAGRLVGDIDEIAVKAQM